MKNGAPVHYPLNYAVNLGTWFVWDPQTRRGGDGAFQPRNGITLGGVSDGLSNTLAMSEVKAYTPYFRNAAKRSASSNILSCRKALFELRKPFRAHPKYVRPCPGLLSFRGGLFGRDSVMRLISSNLHVSLLKKKSPFQASFP